MERDSLGPGTGVPFRRLHGVPYVEMTLALEWRERARRAEEALERERERHREPLGVTAVEGQW